MTPTGIPRTDQPATGADPRVVRFRTDPAAAQRRGFLRRRGFLGVLGGGAVTLGITMLGWIPLARPARAEPGTEFPTCGSYYNGPGGPICIGARYSPAYCGNDGWFITGCYPRADGHQVCFQPAPICRADGENNPGRNAWRWMDGVVQYRCADGHAYWDGAPNPEMLICNAKLTPAPPPPAPPPPAPTTSPSPAPPTGPPTFPALPALPALPSLSNLPLLPR
ncbi:MAG TPA: hypothetical protein VHH34_06780 [Pseudonocardiaceae bacterium]|nr:hypothetical protein [Pseudonocardiaceae bacterium]